MKIYKLYVHLLKNIICRKNSPVYKKKNGKNKKKDTFVENNRRKIYWFSYTASKHLLRQLEELSPQVNNIKCKKQETKKNVRTYVNDFPLKTIGGAIAATIQNPMWSCHTKTD